MLYPFALKGRADLIRLLVGLRPGVSDYVASNPDVTRDRLMRMTVWGGSAEVLQAIIEFFPQMQMDLTYHYYSSSEDYPQEFEVTPLGAAIFEAKPAIVRSILEMPGMQKSWLENTPNLWMVMRTLVSPQEAMTKMPRKFVEILALLLRSPNVDFKNKYMDGRSFMAVLLAAQTKEHPLSIEDRYALLKLLGSRGDAPLNTKFCLPTLSERLLKNTPESIQNFTAGTGMQVKFEGKSGSDECFSFFL
jgi:hypothetical protein